MSKFVVITKQYKDVPRDKTNRVFPDEWPHSCEEFETIEAANEAHPGLPILTVEDYALFSRGLALAHQFLPVAKAPWWKFWSKK